MAGRLVDGDVLRAWLDGAVPALEAARERIDAVNVFPVADGDTGTNVLLTVRGAADAVRELAPHAPGPDVLRALARGALLAARGNSGVIVSRYLGGLAEVPDAALPEALRRAADAARTAVHAPEDGTVLTVAARVADAAADATRGDVSGDAPGDASGGPSGDDVAALAAGVAAGRADLARISAAHPVLRSARVVDAGACALLVLLDALLAALEGRGGPVDVAWLSEHAGSASTPGAAGDAGDHAGDHAFEIMAVLHAPDAAAAPELRTALAAVGGAVAVVEGDAVLTAHVHADDPVPVLAAVGACGPRWTASVRALVGAPSPVVACTAHPELAGALALAGAVALVLPDAVPVPEARAAVARAAQDALAPAHDRSAAGAPAGAASVVVLPGDRLPAAVLDPAWSVPDWASDDVRVLAAVVAGPEAEPGTAAATDLDSALAEAELLLAAGPADARGLTVVLGAGAAADDGLDLADRLGALHPGLPVAGGRPGPARPPVPPPVPPAAPRAPPPPRAEARP
ncbi:DAK2 domain-containing protein [Cellulomonas endometrii]|uniref:DAK2 domain-containing protein n=1 Tax=Cellulomonas endometrii TaxID=3036301 RepID=UPI0024AD323C|nr:DAK2 domain-containing protein [Cellulomonas endometrii]